jgi:hypothetical protein
VPTPAAHDRAIEKIRAKKRGRYKPKVQPDSPAADHPADADLRPDPLTADTGPDPTCGQKDQPQNPESAASFRPPEAPPAASFSGDLRLVDLAATYQDHAITTTNHPDQDHRSEAAATRAPEAEPEEHKFSGGPPAVTFLAPPAPPEPPEAPLALGCPHGNAEPDCLPCRAALRNAQAAQGPAKCATHGLKGGTRPDDGRAHCPLCRRMEVINA